MLDKVNAERGFQVAIHVDAASGGFIAPFQKEVAPFDFRVDNVLSMSASGHKFGESVCGTGWVVWRRRKDLAEHVAISVSYLGGKADSYTLNFSRPASGVYVQFYKLLRLGFDGFGRLCANMMSNAAFIRAGLNAMTKDGKPRFTMLDDGDDGCLPVVTAMLNPALNLEYDDIDLQHALSQEHWYVCGYAMNCLNPVTEKKCPLFSDMPLDKTMFRIVVKANLTRPLVDHLLATFVKTLEFLDGAGAGFAEMHAAKRAAQHNSGHVC